jgi:excisionase family DNA binding protein
VEEEMLALLDQTEPFIADEAEAAIARAAASRLKTVARAKQDIKIHVQEEPEIVVPLPGRVVALIFELLESVGRRVPVSVIPHDAELTTQQAADYLNVSRPYLTRLMDEGKIKHRCVGRHRRVRFGDLERYARQSLEDRQAAIKKVAAEAQRLKLE